MVEKFPETLASVDKKKVGQAGAQGVFPPTIVTGLDKNAKIDVIR